MTDPRLPAPCTCTRCPSCGHDPAAPPAELTGARCPSCDHLTEGHTAAGCWYVVDDHSPSVDGICPCTRVHKPADTPEDPR